MERPAEPPHRCFAAEDSLSLRCPPPPPPRQIPESALSALRGILVSSLHTAGGGHGVDAAEPPVPRSRHVPGRSSSKSPPPPPLPRRRPRLHVKFDSPTACATAGTLQPSVFIIIYNINNNNDKEFSNTLYLLSTIVYTS